MNRFLRIVAVLAILGLLAGMGWMLRQIAAPPAEDSARLPLLSVSLTPARSVSGSAVEVRCRIRNPHAIPVYINAPPQALYYLRQQGKRIILEQDFSEEILKNPQRNPLVNHGGIPRAEDIAPGTERERLFMLRTASLEAGTYEVVVSLGCSPESRSQYLVDGAAYDLPELVDRFLDWQHRVESPPVILTLEPAGSRSGDSPEDRSSTAVNPGPMSLPLDTEAVQFAALSTMVEEAAVARNAGRLAEAEELLLRAQSLAGARLKPLHPAQAIIHGNLGILYTVAGKPEEAESHFTRAQRVALHSLGPQHPETARTSLNLAGFLLGQQRTEEAMLLLDGTVEALGDLKTREVELENLYNAAHAALEKLKTGL